MFIFKLVCLLMVLIAYLYMGPCIVITAVDYSDLHVSCFPCNLVLSLNWIMDQFEGNYNIHSTIEGGSVGFSWAGLVVVLVFKLNCLCKNRTVPEIQHKTQVHVKWWCREEVLRKNEWRLICFLEAFAARQYSSYTCKFIIPITMLSQLLQCIWIESQ